MVNEDFPDFKKVTLLYIALIIRDLGHASYILFLSAV